MAKTESPPFRMVVEKGPRLVPATAADAERLDTWRIGSKVNVSFVRDGSRPMERKWFAILGLVVDQCDVPWTTKEAASEAVKLALGIVNYGKTVGGQFMLWPKSLTELSDPELDDAVRDMMDLIHKMTGVDPETLRKESADVGDDEDDYEPSAPPADDDAAASDSAPQAQDAAANPSAADTGGDEEAGATVPTEKAAHGEPSAPASALPRDDKSWLPAAAKMLIGAAMPGGDPEVVRCQYAGLLKMTPATISQEAISKAISISKRLVAVCEQTEELDLDLIAGIAGCEAKDLKPAKQEAVAAHG